MLGPSLRIKKYLEYNPLPPTGTQASLHFPLTFMNRLNEAGRAGSRISWKGGQMLGGGVFALIIYIIFLKYPMKIKYFGTKLFHCYGIFIKTGVGFKQIPPGSTTGKVYFIYSV